MNNSVRIPFRSYFELRATQELFSEIVNITHTTLKKHKDSLECTEYDRYSGDLYSGNDRYSGLKPPDDAILFTVSGITAIADKKWRF